MVNINVRIIEPELEEKISRLNGLQPKSDAQLTKDALSYYVPRMLTFLEQDLPQAACFKKPEETEDEAE